MCSWQSGDPFRGCFIRYADFRDSGRSESLSSRAAELTARIWIAGFTIRMLCARRAPGPSRNAASVREICMPEKLIGSLIYGNHPAPPKPGALKKRIQVISAVAVILLVAAGIAYKYANYK